MAKSQSHGIPSWTENPLKKLVSLPRTAPLATVVDVLLPAGELFIVGGTVRDTLTDSVITDFDLATGLVPQKVSELLTNAGVRVVESGLKHGTLTAVVDAHHIEITTLRRAYPHTSGFSDSIEEDLSARDFTINAIAYDISAEKLVDPAGGIDDIEQRVLRAVGNPEHRFLEDPLRILRMVRFGPSEGRTVDAATLLQAQALASKLASVSVERIQHELKKILTAQFPAQAIRMMHQLGILGILLPELLPMVGFEQNEFHIEDVFDHTMTVLAASPPTVPLRFAALFHDVGKPHTLSIDEDGKRHFYLHEKISADLCVQAMRRLKFSHEEVDTVSLLVRHHMRPLECGPPGLRRIMRDLGPHFEEWRQLKIADSPPVMERDEFEGRLAAFDQMLEDERARLKKAERKLAVNGDDLIELGFKPGIELGNVLKQLEELVLDDPEANVKEVLLNRARRLLSDSAT